MKYIELTQGKRAIVDDADCDMLMQHKWYAVNNNNHWYASTRLRNRGGIIPMHRLLLDIPQGIECDHINHDGLDNRRSNIRPCTTSQNQQNRLLIFGSSKYKGVSWKRGAWEAGIRKDGKWSYLGRYETEDDAALAYNLYAMTLFKEYACLNEVTQ